MLYGGCVPALQGINLTVDKVWLLAMGPSDPKDYIDEYYRFVWIIILEKWFLDGINLNNVSKEELNTNPKR